MRRRFEDLLGIVLIIAASLAALESPLYEFIFVHVFRPEFAEVLPDTAAAAVRVWAFWTVAAAVLAAVLLRLDRTLGITDAVIGGFLGVWVLAFVAGNVLGPIGLFRWWTIWALLIAGAVYAWRAGVPNATLGRPAPGLLLAALAFALIGPALLILQLGSPMPPFMDILATPASAQRILTFGWYLPFDSDPYGYWDAASQCPATELLYATLALGSGTRLALLAETAAMAPMAGLLVLATYRLGKTIAGDIAGGMAALLLSATVLFRVLPYMHGRTVTHVLVAAGLAFVLDERRNASRLALGALFLGTAVGAHAVVGALGLSVAGGTALFWLIGGNVASVVAAVGLLSGAMLVAAPELAIAIRQEVPYPLLPIAQAAGVALILLSARRLATTPLRERALARWLVWPLTLFVLWGFTGRQPLVGGLQSHQVRFPLLFYSGGLGLALMLWLDVKRSWRVLLAPVTVALVAGLSLELVSDRWWRSFADQRVQIAVQAFYRKVDYWYPFVWVFPAGVVFAWLYRVVSPRFAMLALLPLLIYPWQSGGDPNYHQHSIAEGWAQATIMGKSGYWGETGHRRWAQSEAQRELAALLVDEVRAGRITMDTHVVHLEPFVLLYQDVVLFSVYTGINDDTYIAGDFKPDISNIGGRVYAIADVHEALAKEPPYVVIHDTTRNGRSLAPFLKELPSDAFAAYDTMFEREGMRLLRHRRLRPAA